MNLTRILALALRSILFLVLVVSTSRLSAQLNVNENANNATMSNLIQGSGVIISNFTVISGADQQVSSFTNTNAAGNPLNIPNGLLLSTGRGTQAVGPNNNAGSSVGNGITYVDPDITAIQGNATNDVVVVEFDVIPLCDTMQLTFVFGSEEYAEYTCADFNDAFGFFVSGPGISGPYLNGAENFARLPDGTPVSIGTVNQGSAGAFGDPANCASFANSGSYLDNTGNAFLQADGLTVRLRASGVVLKPSTKTCLCHAPCQCKVTL
jgi:hypothetical protein